MFSVTPVFPDYYRFIPMYKTSNVPGPLALGWSTQSQLATLLSSLIARQWVGLQLYDGSDLKTYRSINEMVGA